MDDPLHLLLIVSLAVAAGHAVPARDYHRLEFLKATLRHRDMGGWERKAKYQ